MCKRRFVEAYAAGAKRGLQAVDALGQLRNLLLQSLRGGLFRSDWRFSIHRKIL